MTIFHKLYNLFQLTKELLRRFIYIVLPVVGALIYIIFKDKLISDTILKSKTYLNNVINLSGILAGFLFTTFGTFMSLPDNKFLDLLEGSGYFKSIYRVQALGIIFLFSAMLIGLFEISAKYMTVMFIFGISEAIGSLYYFYKILTLSRRSSTKY